MVAESLILVDKMAARQLMAFSLSFPSLGLLQDLQPPLRDEVQMTIIPKDDFALLSVTAVRLEILDISPQLRFTNLPFCGVHRNYP